MTSFFSFSFFFPQSSPLLCCPLWPVPCILKDLMQICWEQNALSTNVLPALAFLTAHPPLSLLVFPHPVSPIHFPFTAILMLLLQIYTIQMVREITLSFASPASSIKKEKKKELLNVAAEKSAPSSQKDAITLFLFLSLGSTQKIDTFCGKQKHCISYILSSHCQMLCIWFGLLVHFL